MNCYICGKPAVGQCKSCGRFYCAEHGDVYCNECAARRKRTRVAVLGVIAAVVAVVFLCVITWGIKNLGERGRLPFIDTEEARVARLAEGLSEEAKSTFVDAYLEGIRPRVREMIESPSSPRTFSVTSFVCSIIELRGADEGAWQPKLERQVADPARWNRHMRAYMVAFAMAVKDKGWEEDEVAANLIAAGYTDERGKGFEEAARWAQRLYEIYLSYERSKTDYDRLTADELEDLKKWYEEYIGLSWPLED